MEGPKEDDEEDITCLRTMDWDPKQCLQATSLWSERVTDTLVVALEAHQKTNKKGTDKRQEHVDAITIIQTLADNEETPNNSEDENAVAREDENLITDQVKKTQNNEMQMEIQKK